MFTCLSKLHNSIYSFLQFSRRKEIFKKKNANKPNLPGVSQNVIQHNVVFGLARRVVHVAHAGTLNSYIIDSYRP